MGLNKRLIGAGATAGAGGITPSEHFKVVVYDGNGGTQSITGVGFKPDFVWIKERDKTENHNLFDSTRGVTKFLRSNSANAEGTGSATLTSFDADGFTLGLDNEINDSGSNYVAWCWKAGEGTTSSNSDGSITSTVQANTDAGFSIVTYTGTGANATVGHGLGAQPYVVITKGRDLVVGTTNWRVYTNALGGTKNLKLNGTDTAATGNSTWNDTDPTSSVFSLGTSGDPNGNNATYVAYCFAPVAGYSSFGSYTGNGSSNGPIIETGFEPAFIMVKRTDAGDNWLIFDNKRSPSDPRNLALIPNSSSAELTGNLGNGFSFLSNGFQAVSSDGGLNDNGGTYIYMAFAADPDTEAPTLASSFNIETYTGNGTERDIETGFKPGLVWWKSIASGDHNIGDIIRGKNFIRPNSSIAQYGATDQILSYNDTSYTIGTGNDGNQSGYDWVAWVWKADDNEATIEEVIDDVDAKAIYTLESNANDVTGNYNATASGITYSSGKFGNAATYSGTNASSGSKIYVSNNIYGSSTSIFTVSLWIKCTNTSGEIPIAGNGGTIGGTTGYAIYLNSGKLALTFRTNPNQDFYADTTSINDNAWHHVALTCNNGDWVLYLDNSVNASGTTSNWTGNPTPTFDTYFGNRWNRNESGVIAGQIDQIRIYDRPLTAASITNLYNETTSQNSTLDIGTQAVVSAQSIVSANANAGFSIVKYTGTYPNHQKIPHGLSAAPNMILIKNLSDSNDWEVYHSATGNTGNLVLNSTAAFASNSGFMANTSPTATVFTVGNDGYVNGAGDEFIAYCFHSVSGYSKFGSYTSNATTKITTGFQPDFFIFKYIGGGDWYIQDATQTEGVTGIHGGNLLKKYYVPNTNAAEDSVSTGGVEIMSDGFYPTNWFDTTNGVIYAAFKKNVPSNTTLANSFKAITYTGNGGTQSITGTGFTPDLVWIKHRNEANDHVLTDSIRGTGLLYSNSNDAQNQDSQVTSFDSDGFSLAYNTGQNVKFNKSGGTYVAWCWKAGNTWQSNIDGSIPSTINANTANGFSVVHYYGTQAAGATVGHGLGAAPEVIIVKRLDFAEDWVVYHSSLGNTKTLNLNTGDAEVTDSAFNNTTPTSSVFTLDNCASGSCINSNSGNYIAYCWTSKSGYSKFGNYSGNGSTGQTITTGFQPDFVIIKSKNNGSDWYIIDSVRPNNKFLVADGNASEYTASDTHTFVSTGFTLSGESFNNSGYDFIYMAFKMN